MMPSSGVRSAVVLNGKLSGLQRQRSFSSGTSGKDDVSCMRTPLAWPGRTYNPPAPDTPIVTRFLSSVNLCGTDTAAEVRVLNYNRNLADRYMAQIERLRRGYRMAMPTPV